ncbi:hypothetical protein ABTA89_19975, partial [Acinetobacter baumannii]
ETTLPSLQYYFGGKQGLYLACAQEVAERFARQTEPAAAASATALRDGAPPPELRARLKQTMAAVAQALIASDETTLWSA